jgi:hypothetical protein
MYFQITFGVPVAWERFACLTMFYSMQWCGCRCTSSILFLQTGSDAFFNNLWCSCCLNEICVGWTWFLLFALSGCKGWLAETKLWAKLANATSRWCSQRCSILNGLFWTSIRWLHIIDVFSYDLGIYVFNYLLVRMFFIGPILQC